VPASRSTSPQPSPAVSASSPNRGKDSHSRPARGVAGVRRTSAVPARRIITRHAFAVGAITPYADRHATLLGQRRWQTERSPPHDASRRTQRAPRCRWPAVEAPAPLAVPCSSRRHGALLLSRDLPGRIPVRPQTVRGLPMPGKRRRPSPWRQR
jgi:hypothetical protein